MSKRLRIAIYHNLLFGGAKRTLYEDGTRGFTHLSRGNCSVALLED